MASTLKDSVVHWRKKLERTTDENVILNVIHKLSKVPMTVEILQDTGIGKNIRCLSKKSGKVGVRATNVLKEWRELVHKPSENVSKAVHSKYNSFKSERKENKDSIEKSHKKSPLEKQTNKVKKSSKTIDQQNSDIRDNTSKYSNLVPNDVGCIAYNSVNNMVNSSIKTEDDSSNEESTMISSFSKKRKSYEKSPSTDKYSTYEAKRVKTESMHVSSLDSTVEKCGIKKELNSNSHKKNKDKKSHFLDSTTSPNSHSNNHLTLDSEIKKSSSKKIKKNKHAGEKNIALIKNALKKPTESFTASEASFEDCLNFNDLIPLKKKKNPKIPIEKNKKHIVCSVKKDVDKSIKREIVDKSAGNNLNSMPKSHNQDKNLPPLLLKSPQITMPKLNGVDIASTLPQIQPNYRPLPQRNIDCGPSKKKVMTDEEAIKFTSSRKERTNVYSGRKSLYYTEVPTLFECCTQVLIENIDAIEYLGDVPYFLLKPVLERCTPNQLYDIENFNPYLIDETCDLWEAHCKKDFRTQQLQENETWRDLYLRAHEERETKLKNLTQNICASMSKYKPARKVQLAYVNSVVKPPRDVARKQAKNGTAHVVNHVIKAGPSSSKASSKPVIAPTMNSSASSSKPDIFIPKKPKIAPLMAKTLKSMKQCFRRR